VSPRRIEGSCGVYLLYHWLELWDWLASTGTTEPLRELERGMLRSLD
jgi:hypothetical protein